MWPVYPVAAAFNAVGLDTLVTMCGVTAAYLFDNTLVVLEVTEEVLRQTLERCAAYFTLVNDSPQVSDKFPRPKAEHYNYALLCRARLHLRPAAASCQSDGPTDPSGGDTIGPGVLPSVRRQLPGQRNRRP